MPLWLSKPVITHAVGLTGDSFGSSHLLPLTFHFKGRCHVSKEVAEAGKLKDTIICKKQCNIRQWAALNQAVSPGCEAWIGIQWTQLWAGVCITPFGASWRIPGRGSIPDVRGVLLSRTRSLCRVVTGSCLLRVALFSRVWIYHFVVLQYTALLN